MHPKSEKLLENLRHEETQPVRKFAKTESLTHALKGI